MIEGCDIVTNEDVAAIQAAYSRKIEAEYAETAPSEAEFAELIGQLALEVELPEAVVLAVIIEDQEDLKILNDLFVENIGLLSPQLIQMITDAMDDETKATEIQTPFNEQLRRDVANFLGLCIVELETASQRKTIEMRSYKKYHPSS